MVANKSDLKPVLDLDEVRSGILSSDGADSVKRRRGLDQLEEADR